MQQVLERHNLTATLLLVALFMSGIAYGQKLLHRADPVLDLSETPIYDRLVNEDGSWKPEYTYLDSIEMFAITYLSDGLKVTGFMVKPKGQGEYPCVIFNRGGNRDFGQLKVYHAVTLMGMIAKEGYVVVASNYRGNGGSEGLEEFGGSDVNDVLQLMNVLEEVEGADTSLIGMMGWSRGGMMTYLALARSNRIKAAVVGGAMADLTTGDRPEMEENVYAELIPGYETNKEEVLKARSALYWPEKFPKNTPVLLLHGNADWRVKSTQSLNMAMALDKQRVPYRLVVFEGADHGISEHRSEVMKQTISWFDRYLKEGEALPEMEYHGR